MKGRRVSGYVDEDDGLTFFKECVTLQNLSPESEGKSCPPWGQRQFSYRFTGQPPVSVYDDLLERQ